MIYKIIKISIKDLNKEKLVSKNQNFNKMTTNIFLKNMI